MFHIKKDIGNDWQIYLIYIINKAMHIACSWQKAWLCASCCAVILAKYFVVHRQKADCCNITSKLNAAAYHVLWYKTRSMIFDDPVINLASSTVESDPNNVTAACDA